MSSIIEQPPKLSIVTPCYNSSDYIREAIESVLVQEYPDVEHIVVDGGSTDGTLDILKDYPHLDVISEPDDGIFDALNKGISRASGEYVGWLNSDDKYEPGAFDTLTAQIPDGRAPDLIAGRCEIFEVIDGDERVLERAEFTPASKLSSGQITHDGVFINGCLLNRHFLMDVGEFDPALKASGDREYLIRVAAAKPYVVETTDVVYRYRHHEGSLTFNEQDTFETVKGRNLRDSRIFMREFMNNPDLPDSLVEYCRRGYRARSGALLLGYLKRLQLRRAFHISSETLRSDPVWGLWLIATALKKGSRMLGIR